MEPVSLADFVENEDVKEALDKGVQITEDSDNISLKAGNGRITGLDPDKYYTVEEWDENGKLIEPIQFVSSDGKRSQKLEDIGRVSSGELSGLTNNHHYRIKLAEPLTGSVSFIYRVTGGVGNLPPVNGEVIMYPLPPVTGDFLEFTPTLPNTAYPISSYDIAKVPVSSAGPAEIQPNSSTLYTVVFPGTVVDYVFYNRDLKKPYVLRISCDDGGTQPPLPADTITIYASLSLSTDGSPTVTPITTPFNQIDTGSININFTVSNSNLYNPTTGIVWYYMNTGTQIGTGATFTLNITPNSEYNIIGTHKITVEASISGVPYSTTIEYVITSP